MKKALMALGGLGIALLIVIGVNPNHYFSRMEIELLPQSTVLGDAATMGETAPITMNFAGSGMGIIEMSGTSDFCTETCRKEFRMGSVVSLSPVAGRDSRFTEWSGDCINPGQKNCVIKVQKGGEVAVAHFERGKK